MKKIVVAVALLLAASFAFAQNGTFSQTRSDHYAVLSEIGQENADNLAKQLEGLFQLFNEHFRFDPASLKGPLTVRIFKDKNSFDAYLVKVVGVTKNDFVYLHYPTVERSELVIFQKSGADFDSALAHQAFVQFLKVFIPNPPLWLRDGFAVYFEKAAWNASAQKIDFTGNDDWLEHVKIVKQEDKLAGPKALFNMSADEAASNNAVLYPQSWAYVSFFADGSDKRYNRLLWDSITKLRREATLEENQAAIGALFDAWYTEEGTQKDFISWLDTRKTFSELITDGVKTYGEKNYDASEDSFTKALAVNKDNYLPYYYLGLIAYAKNDYSTADYYYKTALQLGCDVAITNYALGLNAYASNRFTEARTFLAKAKETAPDKYGAKVDEIISKMDASGK
ncbi:MAG: hypothetical protein NT080_06525 [Spirochaetes bacterium]|nr:hypothetical protein [Spirochaetota bacterium]